MSELYEVGEKLDSLKPRSRERQEYVLQRKVRVATMELVRNDLTDLVSYL